MSTSQKETSNFLSSSAQVRSSENFLRRFQLRNCVLRCHKVERTAKTVAMSTGQKIVIGAALAVVIASGTAIVAIYQVFTRQPASSPNVADLIAGTAWEWGHGGESILFGKDGFIVHPGWKQRGLVTRWAGIDEHTVLLTIVEGRSVDLYAILVFSADFSEYTAYPFHGGDPFPHCKPAPEGAWNESQPDRSGSRTYLPVSGRPFQFLSSYEMEQPSYPWVVFGRVTDSQGNGMSNVHISASCGRGSLFPTAATNSDGQGDYRLTLGPGMVWKDSTGRVDVAKTIENTVLQAAIIQASKSGYYEKDLGRQGDLRMAPELPKPGPQPGIAADRIVLPNQPKRVDFVLLPAASITGRVVAADGRPVQGRRSYVVSDKLPPGASVWCEFRPDAAGGFKIGGVPCQSYWFEPADGNLAGVRSNPVEILRAGNYDVEVSIDEAAKQVKARIITAPAPTADESLSVPPVGAVQGEHRADLTLQLPLTAGTNEFSEFTEFNATIPGFALVGAKLQPHSTETRLMIGVRFTSRSVRSARLEIALLQSYGGSNTVHHLTHVEALGPEQVRTKGPNLDAVCNWDTRRALWFNLPIDARKAKALRVEVQLQRNDDAGGPRGRIGADPSAKK
jgi:hypothetical protein